MTLPFPAQAAQPTDAPPTLVIPPAIMPNPNAYDFYVKAGKAIVDKGDVAWAIAPQPVTREVDGKKIQRTFTLAEQEALVQRNAAALDIFRQGFAYESRYPRDVTGFDFGGHAALRNLARLLLLEVQVKAARGDHEGALNSVLDTLRLARDISPGAQLSGRFVAVAIESLAHSEMWNSVPHLNASQARVAMARLEEITAHHPSFGATLEEDKWLDLAMMLELFRSPEWRQWRRAGLRSGTPKGPKSNALRGFADEKTLERLRRYSDQQILHNRARYLDAVIANASRPYAVKTPPVPEPDDPYNRDIIPVSQRSQGRFVVERNRAFNLLLLVALALHAYRLEHGGYPATLNELVPGYLKTIPDDPFALNGALRYQRDGEKYLLYSIGPDGKDDDGRAIDLPRTRSAYTVGVESKGDIVAGIHK